MLPARRSLNGRRAVRDSGGILLRGESLTSVLRFGRLFDDLWGRIDDNGLGR